MPLYWQQDRKRGLHQIVMPRELYKPLIEDIMPFVIADATGKTFEIGDAIYIIEEGGDRTSYWFIQIVIRKCYGLTNGFNLLGITGPWGKMR